MSDIDLLLYSNMDKVSSHLAAALLEHSQIDYNFAKFTGLATYHTPAPKSVNALKLPTELKTVT